MPKTIVIYESMFGNTKRAAEAIIVGMKEPGWKLPSAHRKNLTQTSLAILTPLSSVRQTT